MAKQKAKDPETTPDAPETTPEAASPPEQPAPPKNDGKTSVGKAGAKKNARTRSVKDSKVPDGPVMDTFPKPNVPNFDYDPETMEPLLDGEGILTDVEKKDVRIVVTTGGRKIFCCTIADYEEKFGELPVQRDIYEAHYPHAVK